ncbi:MAG: hypothetical protein AAGA15_16180 [Pseudomonadota bacterium]
MRVISIMLIAALTTGGCARVSESRLNPLNWFGEEETPQAEAAQPADLQPLVPPSRVIQQVEGRPLVAQISELEVTPTLGGVIVRATGTATAAGAYSAQLTTAAVTDSEINLDFRAFQGRGPGGGSVAVARFVSDEELGSARTISVRSASNTIARRR